MVYVIAEIKYPRSPVKIGYASNGTNGCIDRLKSLQTGNPRRLAIVAMCEGGRGKEGDLHCEFSAYHVNGEWFRREGAVAEFIERHRLVDPIASEASMPPGVSLQETQAQHDARLAREREQRPARRQDRIARARKNLRLRRIRDVTGEASGRYNPLAQLFDD